MPPNEWRWRLINTAPKDGTCILIWDEMVHYAYWSEDYEIWINNYDLDGGTSKYDPTHWMPAPLGPPKKLKPINASDWDDPPNVFRTSFEQFGALK